MATFSRDYLVDQVRMRPVGIFLAVVNGHSFSSPHCFEVTGASGLQKTHTSYPQIFGGAIE